MATTSLGSPLNPPSVSYLADGSVSAPGLAFGANANTGIYRSGTNILSIAGGGVEVARFNNTSLEMRTSAIIYVTNGSAAAPSLTFATTPTTGIFNNGTNSFRVAVNGTEMFSIDVNTINLSSTTYFSNGTAAAPSLAFSAAHDMGFAKTGTAQFSCSVSGTSVLDIGRSGGVGYLGLGGSLQPNVDNTYSCGQNGSRFTSVWAANGTIQTSHSSTKEVLGEISEDAEIPQGIYFKRPGAERIHVGFLADNLPKESFYEDGVSIETAAPIGVLCANVRRLDRENKELKQLVQTLIQKLEA